MPFRNAFELVNCQKLTFLSAQYLVNQFNYIYTSCPVVNYTANQQCNYNRRIFAKMHEMRIQNDVEHILLFLKTNAHYP